MVEGSVASSPAPVDRIIRLARPSVVLLCGPAACGKSTFASEHFRPTQIVSSDHCRALISDDDRDQRFTEQAFSLLYTIVEKRLGANRLSVVDSTALTPYARKNLLTLAHKRRVPCVVFLLHLPLEACLARDAGRERQVGAALIERHYQQFQETCRVVRREGFDHVVEFQAENLGRIRMEVVFRPPRRPPKGGRPSPRRSRAPRERQAAATPIPSPSTPNEGETTPQTETSPQPGPSPDTEARPEGAENLPNPTEGS